MEEMSREQYEKVVLAIHQSVGVLAVIAAFRFQEYRYCLTNDEALFLAIKGQQASEGMDTVTSFPKTNEEHLEMLAKMLDSVRHSGEIFSVIAASLTSGEEKADVLEDVETAATGVRAIAELAKLQDIPK